MAELYRSVPEQEAIDMVRYAHDTGGITLFDTAPFYGFGLSELRLGAGLRHCGIGHGADEWGWEKVQISTKVGRVLQPGAKERFMWAGGLAFHEHFDYTAPALEESFAHSRARLGAPSADFLIIHDLEPERHGEDGIHRRLDELATKEGGGWEWMQSQRDTLKTVGGLGAGLNRLDMAWHFWERGIDVDFFLVAGRLSLLENPANDADGVGERVRDFLAECERRDTRVLLGGIFNSGILATGPDDADAKFDYGAAPAHVVARVRRLEEVCSAHNVPLPAAALQYPHARHGQGAEHGSGRVAAIIPGVDSLQQLQQNLELLDEPLPQALWDDLRSEGLCD